MESVYANRSVMAWSAALMAAAALAVPADQVPRVIRAPAAAHRLAITHSVAVMVAAAHVVCAPTVRAVSKGFASPMLVDAETLGQRACARAVRRLRA